MKDGCCQGYQTQDEILDSDKETKKEIDLSGKPSNMTVKEYVDYVERYVTLSYTSYISTKSQFFITVL